MKKPLRHARLVAFFILSVLTAFAKKPKPPADVLVVADASSDPAVNVIPEPGSPVYYYLLGTVERDIGDPHGGEPPFDQNLIRTELTKVLASQGYLETKIGGPMPKLVLIVSWGQANLEIKDHHDQYGMSPSPFDYRQMRMLVGANKPRGHLSSDIAEIYDNIHSNRYYIFVAAFDAAALAKKTKKIAWRTRISIDGRRQYMAENIAHMFADAAPYFGHEEKHPVVVNETIRNATVKMGELKVIDDNVPDKTKEPEKK